MTLPAEHGWSKQAIAVETISLPPRIMASPAQEEVVLVAYAACVCARQHCCVLDGDCRP
jgi:hypothetical protein